jgi:hypothetical protein
MLGKINFTFDLDRYDDMLRGEYWYLHKRCARIEDVFEANWGWHPMGWVLNTDSMMRNHFGSLATYLQKRMQPGVYEHLYRQWDPAIPARFKKRGPRLSPPAPPAPVVPVLVRPGVVYILQAAGTPRIKIGRAISAPIRIETLQTASPYPLLTLRTIPATDAVYLETLLHRRYDRYRRHGEWFELPADILEGLLQEKFD